MFGNLFGRQYAASRATILSEFDRDANETDFESGHGSVWQAGQSGVLIRIERLVNRVLRSTQPAFILNWKGTGGPEIVETSIGRRLREVLPFTSHFGSGHTYSEQPLAFLHACWLIGSVHGLDLSQLPIPPTALGPREAEALNDVVARIRMSACEPWYARIPGDRSYEARQRARTVAEYTASILSYYARTMVVRLDLSYLQRARCGLTIDQVYDHLDRLRYLVEVHPMFECLVGYAWCIEQGEWDGYHIHGIFFFDGSKECRDVHKGFEIGGLWQNDITGGAGHYENCNAHKERYPRLGIGMIHRNDPEQCLTCIDVMQYIAKDDGQHLRIKPNGRRIFGTGRAPDLADKRGRPPVSMRTF